MIGLLTAVPLSRGISSQGAIAAAGVLVTAAIVGVALVWLPMLALLPLALLIAALLFVSAPFRAAFLVFGGLTVLQSSDGIDLIKVGYLLGTGVAFVATLVNLRSLGAARSYQLLRPVIIASLLFAALVAASIVNSLAQGVSLMAWLRDAAPYLLFAAVPVLALDLQSKASNRLVVAMFVIAGMLAAVSFTVEWLDRRNLAELPITRIGLPSGALLSALYVFALSEALLGSGSRARAGWAMLGGLIFALTVITGTRSGSLLLLLVAPMVWLFAAKQTRGIVGPTLRLAAVAGSAVVFTFVLILVLSTFANFDPNALIGRYETIGSLTQNPGSDRSFEERLVETRLAWDTFVSEPFLGTGPGHIFEWSTAVGTVKRSFNLDTSLSLIAKFGAGGAVLFVGVVLAFGAYLRNATRGSPVSMPLVALVTFTVFALLNAPIAAPLEDKGFSFGLLFLLALSLPNERGADQVRPSTHNLGAT